MRRFFGFDRFRLVKKVLVSTERSNVHVDLTSILSHRKQTGASSVWTSVSVRTGSVHALQAFIF